MKVYKHDEKLSAIYKSHEEFGRDINFLGTVFSFLKRKSRFFEMKESEKVIMDLVKRYKTANLKNSQNNAKTSITKNSVKIEEIQNVKENKENIITNIKNKEKDSEKNETQNDSKKAPEGNGGKTDRYVWTQTLQELQVAIKVPLETKSKAISVKFTKNRLKIEINGLKPVPFVDGETPKEYIPEDSTWTLDTDSIAKHKTLTVFISKRNQMEWWDCVVKGDAKIDTAAIQPGDSNIDDLDDETQRIVRKMMFDNQQKMNGLPTSDDEKKNETIRKFMAAHPEMDFSKAKIS